MSNNPFGAGFGCDDKAKKDAAASAAPAAGFGFGANGGFGGSSTTVGPKAPAAAAGAISGGGFTGGFKKDDDTDSVISLASTTASEKAKDAAAKNNNKFGAASTVPVGNFGGGFAGSSGAPAPVPPTTSGGFAGGGFGSSKTTATVAPPVTPSGAGGFAGFGAKATTSSAAPLVADDDDGNSSVISLASTTESEKAKDVAAKSIANKSGAAGGFGGFGAETKKKDLVAVVAPPTLGGGGFGPPATVVNVPTTKKSGFEVTDTKKVSSGVAPTSFTSSVVTGNAFGSQKTTGSSSTPAAGGTSFGGSVGGAAGGFSGGQIKKTSSNMKTSASEMDTADNAEDDADVSSSSSDDSTVNNLFTPAATSLATVPVTTAALNCLRDSFEVYRDFNIQQWWTVHQQQPSTQTATVSSGSLAPGQAAQQHRQNQQKQQKQQAPPSLPRSQWSTYGKQNLGNMLEDEGYPTQMALLVWNLATGVLELGEQGLGQSRKASQMYLDWYVTMQSEPEEDELTFAYLAKLDNTQSNFESLDDLGDVVRRVWHNIWVADFRKAGEMIAKSITIAKRYSSLEPAVENLIQDIIQLLVNPCNPRDESELEAWRRQAYTLYGEAKELLPSRDTIADIGGNSNYQLQQSGTFNGVDDEEEETEEMSSLRDLLMDIVQMCTGDPALLSKLVMDSFGLNPQSALAAHCALIRPNATLPMLADSFRLYVDDWREINKKKGTGGAGGGEPGDMFLNTMVSSLLAVKDLCEVTAAVSSIVDAAVKSATVLLPLEDDGPEKLFALRLCAAHVADLCSPYSALQASESMQQAIFTRNDVMLDYVSMFAGHSGECCFSAWVLAMKYLSFSPLANPSRIAGLVKACGRHFKRTCSASRLSSDMSTFVDTMQTYFDPSRPHQKHIRDVLRSHHTSAACQREVLDPYFLALDESVSSAAAEVLSMIADRYLRNGQIAAAVGVLQHPLTSHRGTSLSTSHSTVSSGSDAAGAASGGAGGLGLLSAATAAAAANVGGAAGGRAADASAMCGDVDRVLNILQGELYQGSRSMTRPYTFSGDRKKANESTTETGGSPHVDSSSSSFSASSSALVAQGLLASEQVVSDAELGSYQLPNGAIQVGEALRSGLIDACGGVPVSGRDLSRSDSASSAPTSGPVADCGFALEFCGRLYDIAVAAGRVETHQPGGSNAEEEQQYLDKKKLLTTLVSSLSSSSTDIPNVLVLYLATWAIRLVVSSAPSVTGRSLVGGNRGNGSALGVVGRYKNQGGNGSIASMGQLLAINARLQEVPVEASSQREVLSQQILQIYRTPALRPALEF